MRLSLVNELSAVARVEFLFRFIQKQHLPLSFPLPSSGILTTVGRHLKSSCSNSVYFLPISEASSDHDVPLAFAHQISIIFNSP